MVDDIWIVAFYISELKAFWLWIAWDTKIQNLCEENPLGGGGNTWKNLNLLRFKVSSVVCYKLFSEGLRSS